jgi:hypothetical protein
VEQILIYTGIAVVAIIVTMLFLLITKIAAIVTIGCALLVGGMVVLFARIELGFWDPLAPVAFVANTAFAFAVSFAFWGIGRWLRWPFFMPKRHTG